MSRIKDPVTIEDINNRINHVKNLILKKIADDIIKKEKRIPSKEEVIKIFEKRRAEHEKRISELEEKQSFIISNAFKKMKQKNSKKTKK
jgi:hypothetical protein